MPQPPPSRAQSNPVVRLLQPPTNAYSMFSVMHPWFRNVIFTILDEQSQNMYTHHDGYWKQGKTMWKRRGAELYHLNWKRDRYRSTTHTAWAYHSCLIHVTGGNEWKKEKHVLSFWQQLMRNWSDAITSRSWLIIEKIPYSYFMSNNVWTKISISVELCRP